MKRLISYFTKFEIVLWVLSTLLITVSFLVFDRSNYLTLFASVVGVTALIFCAKGNPFGQILMIFFCIIYAVISYSYSYFGEMITYLGMSLPMAVFCLFSWLLNPFKKSKAEVKVGGIGKREQIFMWILAVIVTIDFYFILKYFNTANLLVSTLSITTSFVAVYLCFRRSPFFALAYSVNDIILIIMWTLASFSNTRYISVVVCFIAFLFNDLYGFINWQRMKKRQNTGTNQ